MFRKPYFLCEVTVTEDGLIKQKRLPDNANNLANRISLNGRSVALFFVLFYSKIEI